MKQLHEYDTPMTDEVMRDADRAIEACELCEDLERKLAMCREALEEISNESQNYQNRGDERDHLTFAGCIEIANKALKATKPK